VKIGRMGRMASAVHCEPGPAKEEGSVKADAPLRGHPHAALLRRAYGGQAIRHGLGRLAAAAPPDCAFVPHARNYSIDSNFSAQLFLKKFQAKARIGRFPAPKGPQEGIK